MGAHPHRPLRGRGNWGPGGPRKGKGLIKHLEMGRLKGRGLRGRIRRLRGNPGFFRSGTGRINLLGRVGEWGKEGGSGGMKPGRGASLANEGEQIENGVENEVAGPAF